MPLLHMQTYMHYQCLSADAYMHLPLRMHTSRDESSRGHFLVLREKAARRAMGGACGGAAFHFA